MYCSPSVVDLVEYSAKLPWIEPLPYTWHLQSQETATRLLKDGTEMWLPPTRSRAFRTYRSLVCQEKKCHVVTGWGRCKQYIYICIYIYVYIHTIYLYIRKWNCFNSKMILWTTIHFKVRLLLYLFFENDAGHFSLDSCWAKSISIAFETNPHLISLGTLLNFILTAGSKLVVMCVRFDSINAASWVKTLKAERSMTCFAQRISLFARLFATQAGKSKLNAIQSAKWIWPSTG